MAGRTKLPKFRPADALYQTRYRGMSYRELVAEREKLYANRDILREHIKAVNMALEGKET